MTAISLRPRHREDLPTEEYHDALEMAKVIKSCKRVKVVDLNSFITACKASSNAERIGGMLMDMTTKSMISQVWDFIQKQERGALFTERLNSRFLKVKESHGTKTAIFDLVDRFWKLASPK